MKLLTVILSTIGVIAIIWFAIVNFFVLFIYVIYKLKLDNDSISLERDISLYETDFDEWYIIPTISFYFAFDKSHPSIILTWLKWTICISYHIKTEYEEEIYIQTKIKMDAEKELKKNNKK